MFASGALSGLTAALLLTHHRVLAGLCALVSAVSLLAGTVRARDAAPLGGLPGRARFTERVLDVVFDASVLVPLAWVMRSGSTEDAVLAMVGLGFSYLAAYQRARGEALGYVGAEVLSYRLTREGLLVFGLLTGWFVWTLWAFTVLTAAAAMVRAWNIVVQERHARAAQEAAG
jgi:hypothetical protein